MTVHTVSESDMTEATEQQHGSMDEEYKVQKVKGLVQSCSLHRKARTTLLSDFKCSIFQVSSQCNPLQVLSVGWWEILARFPVGFQDSTHMSLKEILSIHILFSDFV